MSKLELSKILEHDLIKECIKALEYKEVEVSGITEIRMFEPFIKNKLSKYKCLSTKVDIDTKSDNIARKNNLHKCNYIYILPRTIIILITVRELNAERYIASTLTMKIYGYGKTKIAEYFEKYLISEEIKYGNNRISTINNNNKIRFINAKSFNNLFIEQDIKNKLLKICNNFIGIAELLNKTGDIAKLNILLTGKPGTGKTSIAKAVSSTCRFRLHIAEYEENKINIEIINNTVNLFDDLDRILINENGEINQILLHDILAILDGTKSANCINIVTINTDIKDEAFMRRFNYIFELKQMSKELAIEMVESYNLDPNITLKNETFPISQSYLQNKIIDTMYMNLDKK